jgi:hypothetical protein
MLGFYPLATLPLDALPGSLPALPNLQSKLPLPHFWIEQRKAEGLRQAAQAAAYASYDETPLLNFNLNEAMLAADVQYFTRVIDAAKITRHTVPNVQDGKTAIQS